MNIFFVDNNPETAARMLCDKHIVKMPLESAQMLSSVWHLLIPTKKIWQDCFSTIHESCAKGFTKPPQCMPDIYKAKDTVQAYRQYYAYHKKDIAYWGRTPTPDWYVGMTSCFK